MGAASQGEEGDTHGEDGQDNIIILGDANLHIDWSVLGFKSTKSSLEDEISWPYQLHCWTGMALSIPVWWRPYRYAGGHTSYIVMATSIPVWPKQYRYGGGHTSMTPPYRYEGGHVGCIVEPVWPHHTGMVWAIQGKVGTIPVWPTWFIFQTEN